jgi:hypothetical protein
MTRRSSWSTSPRRPDRPRRGAGWGEPGGRCWSAGRTDARLWVVHRIDKHVSGLVVFARSARLSNLRRWFAALGHSGARLRGARAAPEGARLLPAREPEEPEDDGGSRGSGDPGRPALPHHRRLGRASLLEFDSDRAPQPDPRAFRADRVPPSRRRRLREAEPAPPADRAARGAAGFSTRSSASVVCEAPIPSDLARRSLAFAPNSDPFASRVPGSPLTRSPRTLSRSIRHMSVYFRLDTQLILIVQDIRNE